MLLCASGSGCAADDVCARKKPNFMGRGDLSLKGGVISGANYLGEEVEHSDLTREQKGETRTQGRDGTSSPGPHH